MNVGAVATSFLSFATIRHKFIDMFFISTLYCIEAVAQRCSVKKLFLAISQNSQDYTWARVSFLTLVKKRLWHRCFPVNFAKFPRTSFLTEHLRWLLLIVYRGNYKHADIILNINNKKSLVSSYQ